MNNFKTKDFSFLLFEAHVRLILNSEAKLYNEEAHGADESSHMEEFWLDFQKKEIEDLKEIQRIMQGTDFLEAMYIVASMEKIEGWSFNPYDPTAFHFWDVIEEMGVVLNRPAEYNSDFARTLFQALKEYGYVDYKWPLIDIQKRIYEFYSELEFYSSHSEEDSGECVTWLSNLIGNEKLSYVRLVTGSEKDLLEWERKLTEKLTPAQKFYYDLNVIINKTPWVTAFLSNQNTQNGDMEVILEKISDILSPRQREVFMVWVKNRNYIFSRDEEEYLIAAAKNTLEAF